MIEHIKIASVVLAGLLVVPALANTGEFSLEFKDPEFKVTIPSLPAMTTFPHPPIEVQTSLRSTSYSGPYIVMVKTPKAVPKMTAEQCAASIFEALPQRQGVPPQESIYKARIDPQTFIAIYASRVNVRLHAHLISAADSKCIEVHASKEWKSPDEVQSWLRSFGKARIEVR